jgi:hypothetical protein
MARISVLPRVFVLIFLASCGSSGAIQTSTPKEETPPEKSPAATSAKNLPSNIAPLSFVKAGTKSCMGFVLQDRRFFSSGHCLSGFVDKPSEIKITWGEIREDGSLRASQFSTTLKSISTSYDPNKPQTTDFVIGTFAETETLPLSKLTLHTGFGSPPFSLYAFWNHTSDASAIGAHGYPIGLDQGISHNGQASVGTSGSPLFSGEKLEGRGPKTKQETLELLEEGKVLGLHFGKLGGFSFAIDASNLK